MCLVFASPGLNYPSWQSFILEFDFTFILSSCMEFHGLMDILIRFSDFKGEIDKVTDRNNHER